MSSMLTKCINMTHQCPRSVSYTVCLKICLPSLVIQYKHLNFIQGLCECQSRTATIKFILIINWSVWAYFFKENLRNRNQILKKSDFQLLKCEYVLVSLPIYDNKVNIFEWNWIELTLIWYFACFDTDQRFYNFLTF